uniref:Schlafen group 3-like DNA/RNA helicase domain-containing protein n=1 Tax=Shewanella sp. (strain MR-7) TaxID=60481 RepID=Q0HZW3_SHESR
MTQRAFYSASFKDFLSAEPDVITGQISRFHTQHLLHSQTRAWVTEIEVLKRSLAESIEREGHIFIEFMIPRMGRRADVVIIFKGIVFVVEFKVGAKVFTAADMRQTHGYALDLKNFHRGSHDKYLVPLLVATKAMSQSRNPEFADDNVASTLCISPSELFSRMRQIAERLNQAPFDPNLWADSGYLPTPTIIEAAQALYAQHKVEDIARSEADTQNLGQTSQQLLQLIHDARINKRKIICFVTGVPGAGKTLVGLNIASIHANREENEYSVFLSGNGPLVAVLQEALARDRSSRTGDSIRATRKETESFIQNIHRFRDEYLHGGVPPEKVAIFDEAQRAWDKEQASDFMRRKRGIVDFDKSEPEFLIEVMDRRQDWAFIIALVGGGQEINKGEAGLAGWLDALKAKFLDWDVYFSTALLSGEYVSLGVDLNAVSRANVLPNLHLATSMRSFRAEKLSSFIHYLVAGQCGLAVSIYKDLEHVYPIKVTRDIAKAKAWVNLHKRANESMGLLASSNGIRLKAEGIFVKNEIDPAKWFLSGAEDIRSAEFLEDVATEFDVQGLELDWCVVAWDADYRFNAQAFEHWQFVGTKWQKRSQLVRQKYLENAYRVLLTRARQGMVIFVPKGDKSDETRDPNFYDHTYKYLIDCGIGVV